MTKIQVEACPRIELRRRATEYEKVAQEALLDLGTRFSFRMESNAAGTVILDLAGTERLLGSPQEIGTKIIAEYGTSFRVNVGIAANPDTALHAARGFSGLTVIAAGQEASCLARLPISLLAAASEILDTLDSWGVRDFKTLSALPPIPLAQRLGQDGLHLQHLARGAVQRELVPAEPPPCFRDTIEIEEPVQLLEPLGFLLHRLLQQLCQRLAARSLATDEIRVDLGLEVHPDRQLQADPVKTAERSSYQTKLKLPVPTQDANMVLKLLQLDLAAHPPSAAVRQITVEALPARVRTTQTGLFQPLAPEPAKLEITLARLRAVVGEKDEEGQERVGFPRVMDSHQPGCFVVVASFSPLQSREGPEPRTSPTLALRMFRPPLPARVELTGGAPGRIIFNNHRQARLKQASGPWQKSGDWWSHAGQWKREEWDVSLVGDGSAAIYRIFKDCASQRWFVEGIYD